MFHIELKQQSHKWEHSGIRTKVQFDISKCFAVFHGVHSLSKKMTILNPRSGSSFLNISINKNPNMPSGLGFDFFCVCRRAGKEGFPNKSLDNSIWAFQKTWFPFTVCRKAKNAGKERFPNPEGKVARNNQLIKPINRLTINRWTNSPFNHQSINRELIKQLVD